MFRYLIIPKIWETCSLAACVDEPLLVPLLVPYNFEAINVAT